MQAAAEPIGAARRGLVLDEFGRWKIDQNTKIPRGLQSFHQPKTKQEYDAAMKALEKLRNTFEHNNNRESLPDVEPVYIPWWRAPGVGKNTREEWGKKLTEAKKKDTENAVEEAKEILRKIQEKREQPYYTPVDAESAVARLPLLVFNNAWLA